MFLEITDTSMFHENLSMVLLIVYQLTGLLSFCCMSLRTVSSFTRLSILPLYITKQSTMIPMHTATGTGSFNLNKNLKFIMILNEQCN